MTPLILLHYFISRDKKGRRAEKNKGKGKKDDEPAKATRQGSPNQNGEDTVEPPSVHEEVRFLPKFSPKLLMNVVFISEW